MADVLLAVAGLFAVDPHALPVHAARRLDGPPVVAVVRPADPTCQLRDPDVTPFGDDAGPVAVAAALPGRAVVGPADVAAVAGRRRVVWHPPSPGGPGYFDKRVGGFAAGWVRPVGGPGGYGLAAAGWAGWWWAGE